jgi:hypothetical protein
MTHHSRWYLIFNLIKSKWPLGKIFPQTRHTALVDDPLLLFFAAGDDAAIRVFSVSFTPPALTWTSEVEFFFDLGLVVIASLASPLLPFNEGLALPCALQVREFWRWADRCSSEVKQ